MFLINIISTLATVFSPVTVLTIFLLKYSTIVNLFFVVAGLLELIASYGLYARKKWSKLLVVILAIMVLLYGLLFVGSNISSLQQQLSSYGYRAIESIVYALIMNIILPILVIYYVARKEAKSFV